ncbi:SURF1 family protein [Candidatus Anaplasma sp. TIGMIC]|uniref:SURF1 family protein n=1 Tax=Candidatus Anaplasma sp. TIGMIC TaxID=3020713 RepID=UPI00232DD127|nr:SURF1 family protein [Candidatus Anaplasma sp. TIGMIC]MDB1135308.1 SURF1 family protein [Candidatus Anaplasma sp. TIGMIC]
MRKVCIVVLPFVMLLALGTWQVFRLREKLQIISAMRANVEILAPKEHLRTREYKKVKILGTYRRQYFNVFAGVKGYYLLQLFEMSDGRHVLVNRGTHSGNKEFELRGDRENEYVNGTMYCKLDSRVKWVAANDPGKNMWFWFDIKRMSEHIQISLERCIVWGDETAAFSHVVPNLGLKVRNDHLEYAVTWYILALVWAGGCIVFHRKRSANEY